MYLTPRTLKRKYDIIILGASTPSFAVACHCASRGCGTLVLPYPGEESTENGPDVVRRNLFWGDWHADPTGLGAPFMEALWPLTAQEHRHSDLLAAPAGKGIGTWSADLAETFASLATALPTDIKHLRPLLREMTETLASLEEVARGGLCGVAASGWRLAQLSSLQRRTFAEYVDERCRSRKFLAWADHILLHETLMTAEECPALLAIAALAGPMRWGVCRWDYLQAELALHVERAFTGENLHFAPEVAVGAISGDERFLSGIETASGKKIRAEYVIANPDNGGDLGALAESRELACRLRNLARPGAPTRRRIAIPNHQGPTPAPLRRAGNTTVTACWAGDMAWEVSSVADIDPADHLPTNGHARIASVTGHQTPVMAHAHGWPELWIRQCEATTLGGLLVMPGWGHLRQSLPLRIWRTAAAFDARVTESAADTFGAPEPAQSL